MKARVIFHLAAPGAIDYQIPPRRWIMIGTLIAGAVAAVMLVSDLVDFAAIQPVAHLPA